MPALFGVDIAGEINKAMGQDLLDATLIKVLAGTATPGSLTAGTNPTTTNHAAKGFIEDYDDDQIDGTLVKEGDRKILLLGASIADGKVPVPGDKIIIEGTTFIIVQDSSVARDPAAATYVCHVRQ